MFPTGNPIETVALVLALAPDETLAQWTEDYISSAPAYFAPDATDAQKYADSLMGNLLENENRLRGNGASARKVFEAVNSTVGTGYASYEDYISR